MSANIPLHPARGVWVEIVTSIVAPAVTDVAPREGCVSRNRQALPVISFVVVAPREGCVSRNEKLIKNIAKELGCTPWGVCE